jgi:hypothetical protein
MITLERETTLIRHAARLALGLLLLLLGFAAESLAAGYDCQRHDWHIQPHGVRADVEFIGMLTNGRERHGEQLPGGQLTDVKLVVEWRNLFGRHQQRLDIIAPDGSLYQSLPSPLMNRAPVEILLPVKGTWITRYGLYGAWCVEVFLDQEAEPVTSRRLVITAPR